MVSPREARKNLFHLHFSVVWMGSRRTVVLCMHCTVTDFCFPCHPWYNRTKEVYTEGSLWKNECGRQLVRKFQDNETWAAGRFELHARIYYMHIPPYCIAHVWRQLIVRRPKSGTAKTAPTLASALFKIAGSPSWVSRSNSRPSQTSW